MKHLLSPLDLSVPEIDQLIAVAEDIEKNPKKYSHICDGKKLATCFYEPSTRTRLSFEAAMLNLGGSVLGFSSADSSSAAKGESVSDTARVIGCYADIIAMRHPKEGAPMWPPSLTSAHHQRRRRRPPASHADADGPFDHPRRKRPAQRPDHRAVRRPQVRPHSALLITALARYENIRFFLISPDELRIPDFVREEVLEANHIPYKECDALTAHCPNWTSCT